MQFYEINILISSKLSLEEAAVFMANLENQFQELGRIVGEGKAEKNCWPTLLKMKEKLGFLFSPFSPKKTEALKKLLI